MPSGWSGGPGRKPQREAAARCVAGSGSPSVEARTRGHWVVDFESGFTTSTSRGERPGSWRHVGRDEQVAARAQPHGACRVISGLTPSDRRDVHRTNFADSSQDGARPPRADDMPQGRSARISPPTLSGPRPELSVELRDHVQRAAKCTRCVEQPLGPARPRRAPRPGNRRAPRGAREADVEADRRAWPTRRTRGPVPMLRIVSCAKPAPCEATDA
jgi:hypothetical protein